MIKFEGLLEVEEMAGCTLTRWMYSLSSNLGRLLGGGAGRGGYKYEIRADTE